MWSPLTMILDPQRMAYALEAVVNPITIKLTTARVLVFFMRATREICPDSLFDRFPRPEFPCREYPSNVYLPHTLSL